MDAVEAGRSFTVTRGGQKIGELIPLRRPRRWVSREQFAAMSRDMPAIDYAKFRADVDAVIDPYVHDPYAE
ncbi:MAG: prevent-host-death protein [Sporichthyaceae bacterium]